SPTINPNSESGIKARVMTQSPEGGNCGRSIGRAQAGCCHDTSNPPVRATIQMPVFSSAQRRLTGKRNSLLDFRDFSGFRHFDIVRLAVLGFADDFIDTAGLLPSR